MNIKKVAFIPARSGSKRIPDKNIRPLNGVPLLAYSVVSAIESGVFDAVICVTDSQEYAEIAKSYGAEAPFLRPAAISSDQSPDFEWVSWVLEKLRKQDRVFDVFSILRPTSPFRTASTIKRAWEVFADNSYAHSLRAVEKCKQHPGKMWIRSREVIQPLMPLSIDGVPWHSNQYAFLPEVYVQNASLEIAKTEDALRLGSISGDVVVPFFTEELEGFDINGPEDWILAEHYIDSGAVCLPLLEDTKD